MKDTAFFENAVRPFLINKMEKTLVDYWLLDLEVALQSFLQPHSKLISVLDCYSRTGGVECVRVMPAHSLLDDKRRT